MRAVVAHGYGDPPELEVVELPDPKMGPDTVLVRTKAVALNPVDWKVLAGGLDAAFSVGFPLVPCWDLAGVVESVGPAVGTWTAGDEVVAYDREDVIGAGTLAELVAVPLRCIGPKPVHSTWSEAAGIPLAGLTAYQVLHDHLQIRAGDTLLVHAASGGVGHLAVQLGIVAHARVIGSASAANHDFLRSLGAEPVEYGDGLTEAVRALAPHGVDAVADFAGGVALDQSAPLLSPGGSLASVVDAKRVRELGGRYAFVRPDASQLAELSRLVDAGRVRLHVSKNFALDEVEDAFALLRSGHVRGKVAIEFPPG